MQERSDTLDIACTFQGSARSNVVWPCGAPSAAVINGSLCWLQLVLMSVTVLLGVWEPMADRRRLARALALCGIEGFTTAAFAVAGLHTW